MPQKSPSFLATVIVVAFLGALSAIGAVAILIDDLIESDGVSSTEFGQTDPDRSADTGSGSGSGSQSGSGSTGSGSTGSAPPQRRAGAAGSLRITIGGTLVAGLPFSATADGTVGPQDESGGGWIVSSYLFAGAEGCARRNPVASPNGGARNRPSMAELPSGNVFLAGPFRMATRQTAPEKPGLYRLCGYLTDPSETGPASYQGELVTERTVRVAARPTDVEQVFYRPPLRNGTYVAESRDIDGGLGPSTFRMTVEGREAAGSTTSEQKITRVVGGNLPTTVCRYVDREPTSVDSHDFDTDQPDAGGNDIYTNTFSSNFEGDIRLVGGAADDDTIHGTLTYATIEGCSGSIAFIARRG